MTAHSCDTIISMAGHCTNASTISHRQKKNSWNIAYGQYLKGGVSVTIEVYLTTQDYELKAQTDHYTYNPNYALWHIHTIDGDDLFIRDRNINILLMFRDGETIVHSAKGNPYKYFKEKQK